MKFYYYTGEVKALTKLGYSFYKLYARNHKLYEKGKVQLWAIEKYRIELKDIPLEFTTKLITFILKNKDRGQEFWETPVFIRTLNGYSNNPNFILTKNGRLMTYESFRKKHLKAFGCWLDGEEVPSHLIEFIDGERPIYYNGIVKEILEIEKYITLLKEHKKNTKGSSNEKS